jgi:transketolase
MVEILAALFFGGVLRHDPKNPTWPDRDRFVLSKGHAAPGLYAALAERGYFPVDWLDELRTTGGPLEGHPNMRRLPGVEASTGSLGQGLSIGIGHALAARLDGRGYRVYVVIGDGESQEGQVWEAAMTAAKYGLDHLTAILDLNRYQQTGRLEDVMPALEPVLAKWAAFGWHAIEIDGHDLDEVQGALDEARSIAGRPQIIIAHTIKGKGVRVLEEHYTNRMHGVALTPEQADAALLEIGEA